MVRDIMNRRLIIVEPDTKVSEVAKYMAKEDVGCVLVLDNNKPRGLLTDRDIVLRCIAQNIDVDDCTIENIMTESLETVRETDGIFECIETMRGAAIRRVPVVNDRGNVVGIVSFGDILGLLSRELFDLSLRNTALADRERPQDKIAA